MEQVQGRGDWTQGSDASRGDELLHAPYATEPPRVRRRLPRWLRALVWVCGSIGLLIGGFFAYYWVRTRPLPWVDYAGPYAAVVMELNTLRGQGDTSPTMDADEAISLLEGLWELERREEKAANQRIVDELARRRDEDDAAIMEGRERRFGTGDIQHGFAALLLEECPEGDPLTFEVSREIVDRLEAAGYYEQAARITSISALFQQDQFPADNLSYVRYLRSLAYCVLAKAVKQCEDRDLTGAGQSLRLAFAAGDVVRTVPSARHWLFGCTIEHKAFEAVGLIARRADDPATLDMLDQVVRDVPAPVALATHWDGERISSLAVLQHAYHERYPADSPRNADHNARWCYPHGLRRKGIEAIHARVNELMLVPPSELLAAARAQGQIETKDKWVVQIDNAYRGALLSSHGFGRDRGLALIAIALERFRLARGVYPDSLEVLAPAFVQALPQDPYAADGKYLYRLRTAGEPPTRRACGPYELTSVSSGWSALGSLFGMNESQASPWPASEKLPSGESP